MTAIPRYLDLDVYVAKAPRRKYVVRLRSPDGGVERAEFRSPFTKDQAMALVPQLDRTRSVIETVPDQSVDASRQGLHSFGMKLFETVFSGDLRAALDRSRQQAKADGAGLRIRLNLTDASELAVLPWELLARPPHGDFLALSIDTPIVRHLDLPSPTKSISAERPLRMLVVTSNPVGSPALDIESEWVRLNRALRAVASAKQLEIERLETASLAALRDRLRDRVFHILHYIGHGAYDAPDKSGLLMFEDDSDRPVTITGEDLAVALEDHPSLGLVLLNSCEGGRAGTADVFSGTAQRLVRGGIPAVVAMQFAISDRAALAFARGFYSALGAGFPVDAAVSEGRKYIQFAKCPLEVGTPLLIMRSADGRVFDLTPEERVVDPPLTEVVQTVVKADATSIPADPAIGETAQPAITVEEGRAGGPLSPAGSEPMDTQGVTVGSTGPVVVPGRTVRRWLSVGWFAAAAVILISAAALLVLATNVLVPRPAPDIEPGALAFADVPLGTAASQSIELTSPGAAMEVGGAYVRGTNRTDFVHTLCDVRAIGPGQPCRIDVSFQPSGLGPRTAELVVIVSGAEQTIPLTGSGQLPEASGLPIAVTPASLDFASVPLGMPGRLIVRNESTASVEVATVVTSPTGGPFAIALNGCAGLSLAPGTTCAIDVRYTPVASGPDAGIVSITVDDGDPVEVALAGPGLAPSPSPSPSPSPTPTPTPKPTPTSTPAPPSPTPTPTPTPVLLVVGNYVGLNLAQAVDEIQADGFEVGDISPPSAGPTWVVVSQTPAAGTSAPPNTPVDLVAEVVIL
jgi:hypothetical protein